MKDSGRYLAMYDVRGIQDYIFRTSKMKDAIGASHIVERLFENALGEAVKKLGLKAELSWADDNGPLIYEDSSEADVKVMYIGGGNAVVVCDSEETALDVSKIMAAYTLEHTYSLQLATAIIDKSDDYSNDYRRLMDEMVKVKDSMMVSKPLDALPVVKAEIKTGLPVSDIDYRTDLEKHKTYATEVSRESRLKIMAGDAVRRELDLEEKVFDSYVAEKGDSSMLAVVHIDGNNIGLRIRELISDKKDYSEAINEMRRISYSIKTAYKKVFRDMVGTFESIKAESKGTIKRDSSKWWIMKVIEAGDDITYVCNASIALATVEYFCSNISKYGMKDDGGSKFRFSACGGVSYFNSHFPFDIAYNVAEECCESAKSRAKEEQNRSGETVGNWVDFQFCRSVHARNLERIRNEEYVTAAGENLLRRPYYIHSADLAEGNPKFNEMQDTVISYSAFVKDMKAFVQEESNLPRSYVKEMRNTYPLGRDQMKVLQAFLKSREKEADESTGQKEIKYPDEFYYLSEDGKYTALLYDALEVADYFFSLDDLMSTTGKEAH